MTNREIQEALKNCKPVMAYNARTRTWIEYAYVNAAITRYSPETGKYETFVELMDKSLHSVTVCKPEYVMTKKKMEGKQCS